MADNSILIRLDGLKLKYEEIVEILGGTVGSLKASYHIAHTKIEQFLKESD